MSTSNLETGEMEHGMEMGVEQTQTELDLEKPPASFMSLPLELRELVYEELGVPLWNITLCSNCEQPKVESSSFACTRTMLHISTQIGAEYCSKLKVIMTIEPGTHFSKCMVERHTATGTCRFHGPWQDWIPSHDPFLRYRQHTRLLDVSVAIGFSESHGQNVGGCTPQTCPYVINFDSVARMVGRLLSSTTVFPDLAGAFLKLDCGGDFSGLEELDSTSCFRSSGSLHCVLPSGKAIAKPLQGVTDRVLQNSGSGVLIARSSFPLPVGAESMDRPCELEHSPHTHFPSASNLCNLLGAGCWS